VLWLLLEVAAYFALTPYPATRRVLGALFVMSLLLCRLASQTCQQRRGLMWGIASIHVALGLFAFTVDLEWYEGQKTMAAELAQECREKQPAAAIWYYGIEAFSFYGDQLGMKSLLANDKTPAAGDWVLVFGRYEKDFFPKHPAYPRCVRVGWREVAAILPVRSDYQSGKVAFLRREGSAFRVALYRVER
jgi:hypothetical protein